jgi:hypothetical protein
MKTERVEQFPRVAGPLAGRNTASKLAGYTKM